MNNRRVNIMPMAGEGLRFTNAGYKKPKPLIDINGKPMFIRSAQCMPDADLWIFICQKKHSIKYNFREILDLKFKKEY